MDAAPDDALREQAREWGRAFLLRAPWEPLTERLSLILVAPAAEAKLALSPPFATFWLIVDRASCGSLPEGLRQPLTTRGAVTERHPATSTTPEVELAIRTVEAVEGLVEGTARRDFELRWALRHAEAVSDRLRRLEPLVAKSRMLPPDGLERAVRGLWLDAHAATAALWPLPSAPAHALSAAGELAGALLRLACLMDDGAHPPTELLRAEAAETRIGQRLRAWLDDLGAGLTGDEAAGRRTVNASTQVLDEVRLVLRERYADRDWLRSPADYQLGARR